MKPWFVITYCVWSVRSVGLVLSRTSFAVVWKTDPCAPAAAGNAAAASAATLPASASVLNCFIG